MDGLKPSTEQECARQLFLKQEGLRIDAYAGSGKTTTLRMLAGSTRRPGLYLAFNRSIADEARQKFPPHVRCSTSHSMAFQAARRNFGYPDWKLTGALTPNTVVSSFRVPEMLTFSSGLALPKLSYCAILLSSVKRFLQSDDSLPAPKHIPRYGALEAISDNDFSTFAGQAISYVQAIWQAMLHKSAGLPLGHDGYLKLWSLTRPTSQFDYILVDEAQDLSPVVLGVLQRINASVVYVGDPYQQIYDWRGAINAMAQVSTPHRVLLSQSYRFGTVIAHAATVILRHLGASHPLRGMPGKDSHLAKVRPDIILSRSNGGVIGNVLKCLSDGTLCHVLGGTKALEILLTDVQRVKQGALAQSPELLGFTSWKDVMMFSAHPEGEYLRALVNLVQEYGESTMLRALGRCESVEKNASVVCSTVHKAKGREWEHVALGADFEAALLRSARIQAGERGRVSTQSSLEAELRLLYVAVTRAKTALHLPGMLLNRFGLTETTAQVLKGVHPAKTHFPNAVVEDPRVVRVVSPYHSPQAGESKEMIALRRIFS